MTILVKCKTKTGKYTDVRDGTIYNTILMPDGKWWSAQNLAWSGDGIITKGRHHYWSSPGNPVQSSVVGSGTHIPTYAEWNALSVACGGNSVAGAALRKVGVWPSQDGVLVEGTDLYGFSAIPSGYIGLPNMPYEWRYGSKFAISDNGSLARSLSSKDSDLSIVSGVNHYISVRFIVDSGNVQDIEWATPKEIWLNQNGVWVKVKEVYTSNGSAWKKS